MRPIRIYTDGACSGNQNETNRGGWGALLEYGSHSKEIFGGEADTTNNRMEMTALLEALKALRKEGQRIQVFSDSAYLMNCFREKWHENWARNGWRTSKKTEVENRDLWEAILREVSRHTIEFYRVKGHVDLASPRTDKEALYRKFVEWNGAGFTFDDFLAVTEKNNRADALANRGIATLQNTTLENETPDSL